MKNLREATITSEALKLGHYAIGVNVTWPLTCEPPDNEISSCFPGYGVCTEEQKGSASDRKCFRGVHDGIIRHQEVEEVLQMGASLVTVGESDHFDIHSNVGILTETVPGVVEKVKMLMEESYGLKGFGPVAFRVNLALPMDAKVS